MRGDSIYNRLVQKYGTFGDRSKALTKYPVWNGIEYVDLPVDNITESLCEYSTEVAATILLMKTQWYQYYPYNVSINKYKNDGNDYPAGCVTTAVVQIMNYHKFGTYKGHQYYWDRYVAKDWTNVPEDVINNIGDLFIHLVNTDNLHSSVGVNGTGAISDRVPIALRNFGYQSGEYEVYSQTKARNDIKKGQPVYASGFNKHLDGHAWVLDGTQSMMQTEIWQIDYWYEGKLQGSELVKRNPIPRKLWMGRTK